MLNSVGHSGQLIPFDRLLVRNTGVYTGVPNDSDEGSVPFRSNGVKALLLCVLADWKGSVTPHLHTVFTKISIYTNPHTYCTLLRAAMSMPKL